METAFNLPELGENIESGEVVEILVSVGDVIEENQPILEIETDKAALEVPSTVSGIVTAIHVEAGGEAKVGHPVLTVNTEAVEGTAATPDSPTPDITPSVQDSTPSVDTENLRPETTSETADTRLETAPAAPSVRQFAREIGIDINEVSGSGPGGRISVEDIKRHTHQGSLPPAKPTPEERAINYPAINFSKWGTIEREPLSNLRRAAAEHLNNAWSTIPHVTNHDKADITTLEQLRQKFTPKVETEGGRLTITAIALKFVISALKQFPKFNASLDLAANEIIYKKHYHLGVAVDTQHGLLVPVIRDADQKNIIELSAELSTVSEKARNRKLGLDEMQGGTFTITNLGGIGGTHFSPIINAPEVAILGIARARIEPVFIDEQFQPRLMLPLALSYDHRLIDGADAARFLRYLVERFEDPFLIALEV
jgi:pyruvate dehydrogenase E2 component (dihydrolipoamide acetyltransferase)